MEQNTPQKFGEYEVVRRIGRGGFGEVYLAQTPLFPEHHFAVKVFDTPGGETDSASPFQDELKNVLGLSHSNIVQVRGFGVEKSGDSVLSFIVMDFIEGPGGGSYNLKQHIRSSGGKLEPGEVKRIFRQILSALGLVHDRRIAHLDLKPENILLDGELNAYVSDFGVSQSVSSHSIRLRDGPRIQGFSPIYAAPEQILHAYGSRHSDVFSLGVMLLESLTGTRPESVHSPTNPKVEYDLPSQHGVDSAWDHIVRRCLTIDPVFRFANARELMKAMEKAPPLEPGPVESASPPPKKRKVVGAAKTPSEIESLKTAVPNGGRETGSGTLKISELLDRAKIGAEPASSEKAPLSADARRKESFKRLGFIGILLGLGIGCFLGWNLGEEIGSSFGEELAGAVGLILGKDVGSWIGSEIAPAVGVVLGGFFGCLAGYCFGLLLAWAASLLFSRMRL